MGMEIKEWFEAQTLLIKLVQTLGLLTDGEPKYYPSARLRIFIPPKHEASMRSSVEIVQELKNVQKQMSDWVEPSELLSSTEERAHEPKNPSPNLFLKIPEAPPYAKSNQPQGYGVIGMHARKLLLEVQTSIRTLARSNQFSSPEKEPVQKAFSNIAPKLKSLIEEVSVLKVQEAPSHPVGFRVLETLQTRSTMTKMPLKESAHYKAKELTYKLELKAISEPPSHLADRLVGMIESDRVSLQPFEKTALLAAPYLSLFSPNFKLKRKPRKKKGFEKREKKEES